jgi:hypothetical protein
MKNGFLPDRNRRRRRGKINETGPNTNHSAKPSVGKTNSEYAMTIRNRYSLAALIVIVFGTMKMSALDGKELEGVQITLTHPSEPSIDLLAPPQYFEKNSFKVSKKNAHGGSFRAITMTFVYPGFLSADYGLPVGDCDVQEEVCRYYASLQISTPDITVRHFKGRYPDYSEQDGRKWHGLSVIHEPNARSILAYYYAPDVEFPSGVYVQCLRASPINIARCRLLFETPKRLTITLNGVQLEALEQWKPLVSGFSEFADAMVRNHSETEDAK